MGNNTLPSKKGQLPTLMVPKDIYNTQRHSRLTLVCLPHTFIHLSLTMNCRLVESRSFEIQNIPRGLRPPRYKTSQSTGPSIPTIAVRPYF
jgi:hypothetical protein